MTLFLSLYHRIGILLVLFAMLNVATIVVANDFASDKFKIGIDAFDQGRTEDAVVAFEESLVLFEQQNNKKAIASVYYSLGAAYSSLEQYIKAIDALEKGVNLNEELKNKKALAEGYYNLGTTYQQIQKHEQAVSVLEKAKESFTEMQNLRILGKVYIALYTSYDALGNSEKSSECFAMYSSIDKKLKKDEITQIQIGAEKEVEKAVVAKEQTEQKLSHTEEVLAQTSDTLLKTKKVTEKQKLTLALKEAEIRETQSQLHVEQLKRSRYAIAFIAISCVLLIALFFGLRLRSAHQKINRQKDILEIQNQNITSSLDYAQMIQNILLPTHDSIARFYENFVLFRAKDIVSGDFYWFSDAPTANGKEQICVALADCTGHGVPGALMSMIGHRVLSEIVNEKQIIEPATVLEMLDEGVRTTLKQDETNNRDGMEIGFVLMEKTESGASIVYSGAKRPLYIIRKSSGKLEDVGATRRSIGGKARRKKADFVSNFIELEKGDIIYITSDGIIDQNDVERKKYGSPRLKEKLEEICILPMDRQLKVLESELENHMAGEEQRDDISLIGLKV